MTEERETVLGRRMVTDRRSWDADDPKMDSKVPWAFLSFKGYKMRREAMWDLVKKYAARIGVLDISPHSLRHSFATHMLAREVDLRQIQEMLGHESIVTTQIYTHTNMDQLKKTHVKHHPRG
jgi:integrase/recombinase XerD